MWFRRRVGSRLDLHDESPIDEVAVISLDAPVLAEANAEVKVRATLPIVAGGYGGDSRVLRSTWRGRTR